MWLINSHCKLNNYYCKLLLDTTPKVSLQLKDWLWEKISEFEILDFKKGLLNDANKLRVQ